MRDWLVLNVGRALFIGAVIVSGYLVTGCANTVTGAEAPKPTEEDFVLADWCVNDLEERIIKDPATVRNVCGEDDWCMVISEEKVYCEINGWGIGYDR